MTFDSFTAYVKDVLARLVVVCIEHNQPVASASRIMKWARARASMIWDSFEADEDVRDVATALYLLSVGKA